MTWSPTGAFREEIRSVHTHFVWGYDGKEGSQCWEVDTSGTSRALEYDDHEGMLLSAWLKTGCWLSPEVWPRLEVNVLSGTEKEKEQKASECR